MTPSPLSCRYQPFKSPPGCETRTAKGSDAVSQVLVVVAVGVAVLVLAKRTVLLELRKGAVVVVLIESGVWVALSKGANVILRNGAIVLFFREGALVIFIKEAEIVEFGNCTAFAVLANAACVELRNGAELVIRLFDLRAELELERILEFEDTAKLVAFGKVAVKLLNLPLVEFPNSDELL